MTDYKTLVKAYRAWLIAVAAVLLAALIAWWYARGYGGNADVGKTIDAIKTNTQTNERRADAIIDATRQREVTARETARKKTADLPADKLCAALEQMLAEYRKDR